MHALWIQGWLKCLDSFRLPLAHHVREVKAFLIGGNTPLHVARRCQLLLLTDANVGRDVSCEENIVPHAMVVYSVVELLCPRWLRCDLSAQPV